MDIDFALLNCAEQLFGDGQTQAAAEIYSRLYQTTGPFRLAGLRGLVWAQGSEAVDLLVAAMTQDDPQQRMFAIHLTADVPGEVATEKFVAVFAALAPDAQIVMLKELGSRGGQAAAATVAEAAHSEDQEVRLAAIEALGGLRGAAALDTLLRIAVEGDEPCQRLARTGLIRIGGADAQLLEVAERSEPALAVAAIRALGRRDTPGAVGLMAKLACDAASEKRTTAIEALGWLTDPQAVDVLVQLVVSPPMEKDLPAIEQSLGRALVKIKERADRAAPLLKELPAATDIARPVLVRQLSKSGTANALSAVRTALGSTHAATFDAAVTALASWPTSAAVDDLVRVIESAAVPEQKATALAGYLRIASASDDPAAMFRAVLEKVPSVSDKKMVLNEIGLKCESLEALDMTRSLLRQPQLQAAAAIATIRIGYKLRNSHEDAVRAVLTEVLAQVDHPDVQKRAQEVLNEVDKYEDHIKQWVAIGPFVDERITSGRESYTTVFEPEKPDAKGLAWKPLTQGIGSWDINLEATYGSLDHCTAYVRTMVWSPLDQEVQVEAGSDDALRIWVNGELIFNEYGERGAAPRQTVVPAKLRQGWNELKLKVVDHEGGWVFGCRIRQPNGGKLQGLKYEAR